MALKVRSRTQSIEATWGATLHVAVLKILNA
ncbi:hypothetical protein CAEBREN_29815 [Caenorhabditis brenneri]|uniref:Uncharacterized protein n=1 Tax=Caenorhabditis brenneri TaxID=135651 RepID=G0NI85_CAEBE|nr:hypothetical protein CAEBREN_29815 [Caenorhabditis brenneri]